MIVWLLPPPLPPQIESFGHWIIHDSALLGLGMFSSMQPATIMNLYTDTSMVIFLLLFLMKMLIAWHLSAGSGIRTIGFEPWTLYLFAGDSDLSILSFFICKMEKIPTS